MAGLLLACGAGSADEAAAGLESATVERRDLVSSVAATGTVEPIRVVDVKSQASGEILELAVELGDYVRQGEVLVRIDPRDVSNAYQQAEADLDVAQARLTIAERRLERVQSLHDSAIVTDEELEGAILEHANANAEFVKARTNLELARNRLNDVVVRAPISGTVVVKNIEEGQIVTSTREVTGGTSLVLMADLAEVQVRTLVDETDIGRIRAGLPAQIRVEAYPEREFRGTVLQIEPQAVLEQEVTMFAVLTRITNEDDLLRPGMNADVEVVIGTREGALALPNGAIKTPDEARQLATALGIEPPDANGGGAGGSIPGRLQAMPPEERRQALQGMSRDERRRLMAARAAGGGGAPGGIGGPGSAGPVEPGLPRPAFVFQNGPEGGLVLAPIRIGLSTWEHTEILDGLAAGEEAVIVPQALIQQQELLERVRSRSGIPGVQRDR